VWILTNNRAHSKDAGRDGLETADHIMFFPSCVLEGAGRWVFSLQECLFYLQKRKMVD
jgi:hypothetical protein